MTIHFLPVWMERSVNGTHLFPIRLESIQFVLLWIIPLIIPSLPSPIRLPQNLMPEGCSFYKILSMQISPEISKYCMD